MIACCLCQAEIPEECKEDFFDTQVIWGYEKRCLTLLAFFNCPIDDGWGEQARVRS
jgi:hypothetical protein